MKRSPWWLDAFVALTITVVWAASFVASVFDSHYTASPYYQAIMMVVATALFGRSYMRRNGTKNGEGARH